MLAAPWRVLLGSTVAMLPVHLVPLGCRDACGRTQNKLRRFTDFVHEAVVNLAELKRVFEKTLPIGVSLGLR